MISGADVGSDLVLKRDESTRQLRLEEALQTAGHGHLGWLTTGSLVRIVFLIVVLALVAASIVSLAQHDVWWQLYAITILSTGLAYQFGWVVPTSVDRWRADPLTSTVAS